MSEWASNGLTGKFGIPCPSQLACLLDNLLSAADKLGGRATRPTAAPTAVASSMIAPVPVELPITTQQELIDRMMRIVPTGVPRDVLSKSMDIISQCSGESFPTKLAHYYQSLYGPLDSAKNVTNFGAAADGGFRVSLAENRAKSFVAMCLECIESCADTKPFFYDLDCHGSLKKALQALGTRQFSSKNFSFTAFLLTLAERPPIKTLNRAFAELSKGILSTELGKNSTKDEDRAFFPFFLMGLRTIIAAESVRWDFGFLTKLKTMADCTQRLQIIGVPLPRLVRHLGKVFIRAESQASQISISVGNKTTTCIDSFEYSDTEHLQKEWQELQSHTEYLQNSDLSFRRLVAKHGFKESSGNINELVTKAVKIEVAEIGEKRKRQDGTHGQNTNAGAYDAAKECRKIKRAKWEKEYGTKDVNGTSERLCFSHSHKKGKCRTLNKTCDRLHEYPTAYDGKHFSTCLKLNRKRSLMLVNEGVARHRTQAKAGSPGLQALYRSPGHQLHHKRQQPRPCYLQGHPIPVRRRHPTLLR